jgi:ubiquinone/menaquinone biosynthesis C-methylase UbiE
MRRLGVRAEAVLEIGCGAGERLAAINQQWQSSCCGVDPSKAAVEHARKSFAGLTFEVGTADILPFSPYQFDLVIFGFCLYLIDPADYFAVAREADRVLKDRGLLIIYDFSSPVPYANRYQHREGVMSRKMDWSKMFTWNPAYSLVSRHLVSADGLQNVDSRITVDVLVKNMDGAFAGRS